VNLAYEMATHGLTPPNFYDAGWYVVCENNFSQYSAMWQEQDFRDELEACSVLAPAE
jgi:hypothetical protein